MKNSAQSGGGAVKKVPVKAVNKNIAARAAAKKSVGPRVAAQKAARMGGGRGGKRMSANRLNP